MDVAVLIGDAETRLRAMPDASVHCIVTSPPYWRQRDYGHEGQIGLEATPEAYVERLVAVFRAARRVLRDDGSLWLNIGDKWAAGGLGGGGSYMADRGEGAWSIARNAKGWRGAPPGYKPKDLLGLPWMLAFALRADGWYLRSANVWAKPNGMPESVRDRPSISHEYVFQLSKSATYYYGYDDVRLPPAPASVDRLAQHIDDQMGSARAHGGTKAMKAVTAKQHDQQLAGGAALRSVWWLAPAASGESHYAMMPEGLAALCILAGCPKDGTVLDPFGGAGTTGLVADRLGRGAVLIELNADYAEIAERRIRSDAPLLAASSASGARS